MHLKKTKKPNGRVYLSITDSYYDKTTKTSRSKTVESLGYLDDLALEYDDPIAYFEKRVEELRAAKKKKTYTVSLTFSDSDKLQKGDAFRKNYGFSVINMVYRQLDIDKFITNRQKAAGLTCDANSLLKIMLFTNMLSASSRRPISDAPKLYFDKLDLSARDINESLAFFCSNWEDLQQWINERITRKVGRKIDPVYYNLISYTFDPDSISNYISNFGIKKIPKPQVEIGLFADSNGIPITYELMLRDFSNNLVYHSGMDYYKHRYSFDRAILIGDMSTITGNKINYAINAPFNDGYILNMPSSSFDESLRAFIYDESEYQWRGTHYKMKSRLVKSTVTAVTKDGDPELKQVTEKQVVFWSEKYARRAQTPDGYYVLKTSELNEDDDKIIDLYRGFLKTRDSFKLSKSDFEAKPIYTWTKDQLEVHFMTGFISLTIARLLETKLGHKYSTSSIFRSLSRAECTYLQQDYYLFDYFDDILDDLGKLSGIDYSKRIRNLSEMNQLMNGIRGIDL